MTCFNPKYAIATYKANYKVKTVGDYFNHIKGRLPSNGIKTHIHFVKKDEYGEFIKTNTAPEKSSLIIPCGKCIGCKLDKASEWATRCYYESKQWKNNCFITLTYNNKNLKSDSLVKRDMQLFLKKLRKDHKGIESRIYKNKEEYPIRYFYSGEYGGRGRPHFHIGVFNWIPNDLKFWKWTKNKNPMYRSETVEKLWNKGFIIIEDMNYETATYIARYTVKKLFKEKCHYQERDLVPEFIETSRRGGIGYQLLEKQAEFERMKRNYGIWIYTRKGARLAKIPNFIRDKWRHHTDEDEQMDYLTTSSQNRKKKEEETINKLEELGIQHEEYLKRQKSTLIAKLRNKKSLNRERIDFTQGDLKLE